METVLNALRIAVGAIFTNKTRTFLTMLGVIIGVGSVILLTSIGTGLQNYVSEQFNSFGANNIYVMPGDIFGDSGGGFAAGSGQAAMANNKMRLRDLKAVENLREHIVAAAPEYTATAQVAYKEKNKRVMIYGTNASYATITDTKTDKGRFFTQAEYLDKAKVIVLGPKIAENLFGKEDPVGKRVRVASETFRVVGVAATRGGGLAGPTLDNMIYMPVEVAMNLFNAEAISQMSIQVRSADEIPAAIADVKKELGKRLKKDEFSVMDQTKILETVNQVLGALTAGLGGIAAISLVVGGIGILNIMLVSVIERTREIGLRKALGATPNVILTQFLIESALLSVCGGMIGTAIAYLLTLVVNQFIPAKVTMDSVVLAFGVSAVIGIVFGVIPARRASQLSPIEALRYE